MKKLMFTALLCGAAFGAAATILPSDARAEGESAIRAETRTNTGPGIKDNSYAHGTVSRDEATGNITVNSTTGTAPGSASATISDEGQVLHAQTGARDGSDAAPATAKAQVSNDMTSKAGTMKTRAKGAMGMLNPDEIRQVQTNLRQAGYSVQADGVWGPQTREAIKSYQKQNNLPVTGMFDTDTRASFSANADRSNADSYGNNN